MRGLRLDIGLFWWLAGAELPVLVVSAQRSMQILKGIPQQGCRCLVLLRLHIVVYFVSKSAGV
jgi:hypothetical protein